MNIPEWDECKEKADADVPLSKLELFILDNEPAGKSEPLFRDQLNDVVLEVSTQLEAENERLRNALEYCINEADMGCSRELPEWIAKLRAVSSAAAEPTCQHDLQKPAPTIQLLGSAIPNSSYWLARCTVCKSQWSMPIAKAT
jgi:hypothetical protein